MTVTTKQFEISRVFKAPRELVYQACTEKAHLEKWWGPKGFALTVEKLEVKPGGIFHYKMTAGENVMFGKWVFEEVKAPEKLVFISSFADKDCNVTRHFAAPTWPLETRSTMSFTEEDGGTRLTITAYAIKADATEIETFENGFESMKMGYGSTLDALQEHLANVTK